MIPLPKSDVKSNDVGLVFGWGLTSYPHRKYPRVLQKARMRVFSNTICLDMFNFKMNDRQFCAYNPNGTRTCIVSLFNLITAFLISYIHYIQLYNYFNIYLKRYALIDIQL
jgi:hypothetical protein